MPQELLVDGAADATSADAYKHRWFSFRPRGPMLGGLVGAFFALLLALNELGALLGTLHVPGVAPRGMGGGGLATEPNATLEVWRAFVDQGSGLTAPFHVAMQFIAVDMVFVVVYVAVVRGLARPGGDMMKRDPKASDFFRFLSIGVMVLGAVDVVENSALALAVWGGATPEAGVGAVHAWVLDTSFVVKTLLTVAVFVPLVVFLFRWWIGWVKRPDVRHGLVMSRAQILAVSVVAVIAFLPLQTSDVFLDLGVRQLPWVMVQLIFLVLGVGIASRLAILRDLTRPRDDEGRDFWEAVAGATMLAVALFGAGVLLGWTGLPVLGVILFVVMFVSGLAKDIGGRRLVRPARASTQLPVLLATAPLLLVGLGLVKWTTWPEALSATTTVGVKPVAGTIMAVGAGAVIPWLWRLVGDEKTVQPPARLLRWPRDQGGRKLGRLGWGIVLAVLAAPSALMVVGRPEQLGPIGLVLGAAGAISAGGLALVLGADWFRSRYGLPALFRLLGLRRIPVLSLVVVWALANAIVVPQPEYYNARVVPLRSAVPDTQTRPDLETWFERWTDVRKLDTEAQEASVTYEDDQRRAVPMVFVAAEGGGIRAAYWTDIALSAMFRDVEKQQAFFLSGTSGGSVGIATFLDQNSLRAIDDLDFLSATLERWFTRDLPRSLLRWDAPAGDRIVAQEEAFEAAFSGLGAALHVRYDVDTFSPLLVFNAASVDDGCLAAISPVHDLAGPAISRGQAAARRGCLNPDRYRDAADKGIPATFDVFEGLCRRSSDGFETPLDLRMSTAMLLSARFPFVAPAGRITICSESGGGDTEVGTYDLVDGGYVDNSATSPVLTVMPRVMELVEAHNATAFESPNGWCAVPILLQIDNGAETGGVDQVPTGSSLEILTPLKAFLRSSNAGRDTRLKAAAADFFTEGLEDARGVTLEISYTDGTPVESRYVRTFPTALPGRDASLGWLLSDVSRQIMDSQLPSALEDAVALLAEPLVCSQG